MIRHGLSHAAVSLTCVIGGEMFTRYLLDTIPSAQQIFDYLLPWLNTNGIYFSPGLIALLFTVSMVSFIWGVLFKSMAND